MGGPTESHFGQEQSMMILVDGVWSGLNRPRPGTMMLSRMVVWSDFWCFAIATCAVACCPFVLFVLQDCLRFRRGLMAAFSGESYRVPYCQTRAGVTTRAGGPQRIVNGASKRSTLAIAY